MKSANGNATNRKKEGTSKQSFVYYGKKKKMQTKQTQICSTLSLISTVYVCLAHTKKSNSHQKHAPITNLQPQQQRRVEKK